MRPSPTSLLHEDQRLRDAAMRTASSIAAVQTRLEREMGDVQLTLDLQESVSLLHATLESSPDGVIVCDRQLCIRVYNRRFSEMWNVPAQTLSSGRLAEIERMQGHQVQDRERFSALSAVVRRSEKPRMSHTFALKDGRVLERHASPQMVQGAWVGTVYNWRDITATVLAQQQLHEGRERLNAVFDATFNGLIMLDNATKIVSANPAACIILGLDANAMLQRPVADCIVAVDGSTALRHLRRKAMQEGTLRGRIEIERGGSHAPIKRTINYQISTSVLTGLHLLVLSDITDQLEADQLRITRDIAEQASRNKSTFLSRLSHELRTPMTAIMGYSELLLLPRGPALHAEQRGRVDRIRQAGQHLLNIIDELVDIAQIEQGVVLIRNSPVNLREVVTEAVRQVEVVARKQGVQIKTDAALAPATSLCHTDRTRLLQILLNLLSNAIKYNQPGGTLTLRIAHGGDYFSIHVIDTGMGMTTDQIDRLFTPYDRLGREHSIVPGTGVGLVITRKLIALLGGELTVQSTIDRGSEFSFRLPVGTPPK